MDVLTFETCWAVNSEIIKQVTSSWSIFIQLYTHTHTHIYIYIYILPLPNTLLRVFLLVTDKPVARINSTLINRKINSVKSKIFITLTTGGIYTFRQILRHVEKPEHWMIGAKINSRFVRLSVAHEASLIRFR